MKYWRGYLVAAVLGFFTWALLQFAHANPNLIDMIYPYITRLLQGTFAIWTGTVEGAVWQVFVVLFAVGILVSIVLMIILRWNPIQLLGWVLVIPSLLVLLHTGMYGLNDYASSIDVDVKLDLTDYTISELEEATIYYRDTANALSSLVRRNEDGSLVGMEFAEITTRAEEGFRHLVYEDGLAVFAGSTVPVKELGWADYFSSIGVTDLHIPLTGESCVNTQIPMIALPFKVCRQMALRMSISGDGSADFAAFMVCDAHDASFFQYSGHFMAFMSCYDALASLPGEDAANALDRVNAEIGDTLWRDMNDYRDFFAIHADYEATDRVAHAESLLEQLQHFIQELTGTDVSAEKDPTMYDLLVSWHIQEVVLPFYQPPEEERFDPYDENNIFGSNITGESR